MIDATSGSVISDGPAGTTQLMVKADARREGKQPNKDAHHEVARSSSSMTLQVEQIFAGPEHRFDPLTDGGEMRSLLLLVGPGRSSDGATQILDPPGEVFPRVPLVTDDGLPTVKGSGQQSKSHFPLRPVGRCELDRSGGTVGGAQQMQPAAPEPAGVTAGVSVTADIRQSRASDRLQRTSAFDRRGVKQKQIITRSRALGAKDPEEPFDGFRKTGPALVIGVLGGKTAEQVPELPASSPQEPAIGRDAHEDLSHGQRDDLGVAGTPAGIPAFLWQKVIGCAINDGAEGVEVGVHRGLLVDGVANTADFGPSASHPFRSNMFVASII